MKIIKGDKNGKSYYEQLFIEMVTPSLLNETYKDYAEDVAALALAAWNTQELESKTSFAPPGIKKQILATVDLPNKANLLDLFIKEKQNPRFKNTGYFVQSIFHDSNNKSNLHSVVMVDFEGYLSDAQETARMEADEFDNFDFDESFMESLAESESGSIPVVNNGEVERSALILESTPAFAMWLQSTRPGMRDDYPGYSKVMLIDVYDYMTDEDDSGMQIPDFTAWLADNYQRLLSVELDDYCEDRSLWPKDLSLKTFHSFFKIKGIETVLDFDHIYVQEDDEDDDDIME